MTVLKRLMSLTLVLCLLLGGVFAWLLLFYKSPPVDPAWALSGSAEIPAGAVTVRFTGTSTLLFSDGETRWMVDGWFSRPGPFELLFGKIAPDLAAIGRGLAANEVTNLDAVFPVHSHYDHAMDAPEVALRTGAVLMGSESTANIGRGWGLPESQIQVVADRASFQLGEFVITPIVSRHFEFPDPELRERALADPLITAPLVPPVSAFDYKLGVPYVLHVSHPRGSWLIVGSAGYLEGALEGFEADTVLLGVGGLGSQTDAYRESFWRETVGRVKPSRIIPIHYDSLTAPAEGPFRGPVNAEAFLAGGLENTRLFLQRKQAENPGLRFNTLPRFDEVVLFE
ncbi:MAG: MBL fold metallo-hydrolase [Pseudomonadales bacterium]|nr:MBL fold metallo-hydrolase [Halioglobus sp.]MCP5130306.1 MBL fold metallo-hydrolase [Pseudomonadales bacterium]